MLKKFVTRKVSLEIGDHLSAIIDILPAGVAAVGEEIHHIMETEDRDPRPEELLKALFDDMERVSVDGAMISVRTWEAGPRYACPVYDVSCIETVKEHVKNAVRGAYTIKSVKLPLKPEFTIRTNYSNGKMKRFYTAVLAPGYGEDKTEHETEDSAAESITKWAMGMIASTRSATERQYITNRIIPMAYIRKTEIVEYKPNENGPAN